jgi:hypothetical protein
LNSDQEVALEKYEEVIHSLDLSRDFCKQFQIIANVANKEGKREARRVIIYFISLPSVSLIKNPIFVLRMLI